MCVVLVVRVIVLSCFCCGAFGVLLCAVLRFAVCGLCLCVCVVMSVVFVFCCVVCVCVAGVFVCVLRVCCLYCVACFVV